MAESFSGAIRIASAAISLVQAGEVYDVVCNAAADSETQEGMPFTQAQALMGRYRVAHVLRLQGYSPAEGMQHYEQCKGPQWQETARNLVALCKKNQ